MSVIDLPRPIELVCIILSQGVVEIYSHDFGLRVQFPV